MLEVSSLKYKIASPSKIKQDPVLREYTVYSQITWGNYAMIGNLMEEVKVRLEFIMWWVSCTIKEEKYVRLVLPIMIELELSIFDWKWQ